MRAAMLVFAVLIFAQAQAQERFVSKENKFSIQFPAGWKAKMGSKTSVEALSEDDALGINIECDNLPAGLTVERYIKVNDEFMTKKYEEYKKIDGGTIETSINSQARWQTNSYKDEGETIKYLTYYIFSSKDRRFWIISCTARQDVFDKSKGTFDSIVRTIRREDPAE